MHIALSTGISRECSHLRAGRSVDKATKKINKYLRPATSESCKLQNAAMLAPGRLLHSQTSPVVAGLDCASAWFEFSATVGSGAAVSQVFRARHLRVVSRGGKGGDGGHRRDRQADSQYDPGHHLLSCDAL